MSYYKLGLLAISGDCAEGGMSSKADFIKFPDKYIDLIKKYLVILEKMGLE